MEKESLLVASLITSSVTTAACIYAFYKWWEAKEKSNDAISKNYYKELSRDLILNYADLKELPLLSALVPKNCSSYYAALANHVILNAQKLNVAQNRVLDVGSGVGGLSFILSKTFKEVIGADINYDKIVAAKRMKEYGSTLVSFPSEGGSHCLPLCVHLPPECKPERVDFWDEDCCNMSYKCGKFDGIIAADVLSHMNDPQSFLSNICDYVDPGGLLIISDPYNWVNGPEEIFGSDGNQLSDKLILKVLESKWEMIDKINLPYFKPRTLRVGILCVSEVTIWQRKADVLDESDC